MVYEVIQECTTEEKCGAALLKEGAQTHLPPPECPRDQVYEQNADNIQTNYHCKLSFGCLHVWPSLMQYLLFL